ncbi:MAG: UDP-N-acetylglucosamine 1-carboxyvinyltransferase [Candidatus Doudnabacteria bacterium]
MSKFIINGGKKLKGEMRVSGSKNALFPLFAASLLTIEPCRFTNVPEIKDKQVMVDLITDLGVEVQVSDHALSVNAANLNKSELNPELTGKLRGSIVLLGALLGRTKKAKMSFPGGDLIGKRPIDAHVASFEALGANVSSNGEIEISAAKLKGAKIVLPESSVTATENAILASVLAQGQTTIKLAAMEPHVQQLCEFLNKMGAKISGIGTTTIIIDGVKNLHGAEIELIPDSNEAASFIALGAATKADLKVTGLNPEYLDDFLMQLAKMKVNFDAGSDFVHVSPPKQDYAASKIQCGLYPKLASDDVPALAVLATQATGESLVYEWLYENRLGYIDQLKKMGAQAEILDPHRVKITGPTPLHNAKITSYDLRMGITLVIAALVANGESEIDGVEHIDRGYEKLEERLGAIGADIKRTD